MKVMLAIVIAVMLLMALAPIALANSSTTVYVSVSVDGKLLVAAQPITVTNATADGAIKEAHKQFYSGGESGYAAGIDPTYNMFLISKCWGVTATPFVIVNGAPLGGDATKPLTAEAYTLVANDNVIVCTSSDAMNKPATPVALTATVSGDKATVTAISWLLDFMTFTYSHSALAGAKVIDPTTSASLGTTDANGQITVTTPASGVVAIDGLAAINVKNLPSAAAPPATTSAPAEGTISYVDAKNYIGQTVTIEAQVFEKVDATDYWVLYLGGPSTDANAAGIEVLKTDVSKFPADLYIGKVIRITGKLHTNPVGGASFSLTDPAQIQETGAAPTTTAAATSAAPATSDFPLFYGNTLSLIIWGIVILTPIAVVVIVKMVRQTRTNDKPATAGKQ
jgi:hypothetical protein